MLMVILTLSQLEYHLYVIAAKSTIFGIIWSHLGNSLIENSFQKFNVPDKLNCFARWKNRLQGKKNNSPEEHVRQYIAAYLSRGLQRNVRQVYKHVVNHYSRPKKGHYTKDEQKIMDICFHHDPKRAPVILSEVLSREPRGLYNRLKFTVNGKLSCIFFCKSILLLIFL